MINAIFAVDSTGSLGLDGSLPWAPIAEDFAWFKENTMNGVVVMGRRTWDDPKMPKPLPGRTSYVFTSRPIANAYTASGDDCEKLKKIEHAYPTKTIWVIGGKDILESARPVLDNLYLTYIKAPHRADVKIHLNDYLVGFRAMTAIPTEHRRCTFMIYKNVLKTLD
jgi:dihydrofolate reductase